MRNNLKAILLTILCLHISMILFSQSEDHAHEHNYFNIQNYELESGNKLDEASLFYVSNGKLNSDSSNVILLQTGYAGGHQQYDFLIGPGLSLDPEKYFIVITELFAGGKSSSPSNTPPSIEGRIFPDFSIRDNINASYQLLTERFKIGHLKAVIGFSMGAQQAFQWAVSYPNYMDLIVPICGTAKTYPHGVVRLESANKIIEADPGFNDGNFETLTQKTKLAWASHWVAWIFSQEWWRKELYKPGTIDQVIESFSTFSDSQLKDLYSLSKTWQNHNVGDTEGFGGDIEKALKSIKARVLYMIGETDLYFPLKDAQYESQFITNLTFTSIPSIWGHLAGSGTNEDDRNFINEQIRNALE